MGKIEKFFGNAQEVEIKGEKFMFKPLTVKELPLLTRLGSTDESVSSLAVSGLIKIYLLQIDPEATDEQMDSVSAEYTTEIMDAIMKVNNLDDVSSKMKREQKLIARIKANQEVANEPAK